MKTFLLLFIIALFVVFICLILALITTLFGWCNEFIGWMERRGWRYSTRELLVMMTIVAGLMGLIGILMQMAIST
jgi:hypothetical protein